MSEDIFIELRRTPLWSSNLRLLAAVAAAFTLNTVMDVSPSLWRGEGLSAEGVLSVAIMAAAVLALAMALCRRTFVRRKRLLPIRIGAHTLRLPVSPESNRTHEVSFAAMMAVGEGGRPPKRHFFIESERRIYHLPEQMFAHPDGPASLFSALRLRLQKLPQGTKLLADTEKLRRDALRAMAVRPTLTHALIGINAVFFLNTWLKGALSAPFGLLRWGANAPALVYRGELYRLAAANFLHGHWLHITMNMLALWYLGSLMERLLGWARFSTLYLSAGALAMAASAYNAGAVLTVGASGAIFGLLGGFAVVSLRLRQSLPMGVRQSPRWWATMILVNACIPMLWPVVDFSAHIAGFTAGAVMVAVMLGRPRRMPQATGKPAYIIALLLLLAFGASLAKAVVSAANTSASQEVRFGALLLADKRTPASTLNTLAWLWMADPASTHEHLLAARDACSEAVRRNATHSEYQATLAMVCQRLKDTDCAIDAWHAAMLAAHDGQPPTGVVRNDGSVQILYAHQLAKVLQQKLRTQDGAPRSSEQNAQGLLELQRHRDTWVGTRPESSTPPTATGSTLLLLGEGAGQTAAALVLWQPPQHLQHQFALPHDLNQALADAGVASMRGVFLPGASPTTASQTPWSLWRLPSKDHLDNTDAL